MQVEKGCKLWNSAISILEFSDVNSTNFEKIDCIRNVTCGQVEFLIISLEFSIYQIFYLQICLTSYFNISMEDEGSCSIAVLEYFCSRSALVHETYELRNQLL